MKTLWMLPVAAMASALAWAAPGAAAYRIDPDHTFPSFEADHMGVSVWRGKFNKSAGNVTFERAAGLGTVDVTVDLNSVDFGHDKLNAWAAGPDFFDTAKFGNAHYVGKLAHFVNGTPTELDGELTLHGVTHPLKLKINAFNCILHPMLKRELCGADAYGVFQRDQYGLDAGKAWGFKMDVTLRIQVEAVKEP
ncbi:MAG: YceI family protein [Pseudomonadota bacterium]